MTITEWAEAVKQRDGNRCAICGSENGIQAHHIKTRVLYPESATELENGIALCKACHLAAHGGANRLRGRDIKGKQADPEGRAAAHLRKLEEEQEARNRERKAIDCAWRSKRENGAIIIQAAEAAGQTPNQYIAEAISMRLQAEGYGPLPGLH